MKLSDIKGERTLEVIADIINPIANIAEDETASERKCFADLLKPTKQDISGD